MFPFDAYEHHGRRLLGKPDWKDSARHFYALPYLELSGGKCAYCARDLAEEYESWLNLSVDHVVPTRTRKEQGYPENWVQDKANIVASCRACNEFLNGFRVGETVPASEEEFLELRDRVFQQKRDQAMRRHHDERDFFLKNVKTGP